MKDAIESWIPLKDIEELHTVEVTEFVVAQGIVDEPAFKWWDPYSTIRKTKIALSSVKTRIRKTTHNVGIEISTSVADSERIDSKTGNNL